MTRGRPQRAWMSWGSRSAAICGSRSAVRVSCQTMALCTGLPVCRSHTTVVSRWLVMPSPTTCSGSDAGVGESLGEDAADDAPDLGGVVLDPAGAGIVLAVLPLGQGDHPPLPVEQHAAGGGCALVEGGDVPRGHRVPAVAEHPRDLPGDAHDVLDELGSRGQPGVTEPHHRAVDAHRCHDVPAPVTHRSGDPGQFRLDLFHRDRRAGVADVGQLPEQLGPVGDGAEGQALQRLPHDAAGGARVEGQQHLAQRTRMQRERGPGVHHLWSRGRRRRRGGPRPPGLPGTPRSGPPRRSGPRACPPSSGRANAARSGPASWTRGVAGPRRP